MEIAYFILCCVGFILLSYGPAFLRHQPDRKQNFGDRFFLYFILIGHPMPAMIFWFVAVIMMSMLQGYLFVLGFLLLGYLTLVGGCSIYWESKGKTFCMGDPWRLHRKNNLSLGRSHG